MSSSFAYPELAAPSRVDSRWAFDGTTCIMLSGSGDGPISVQLWLEALKASIRVQTRDGSSASLSKAPSAQNWPAKSWRLQSCNKRCSNGRLYSTTMQRPLSHALNPMTPWPAICSQPLAPQASSG
jgi:hypothetical protein